MLCLGINLNSYLSLTYLSNLKHNSWDSSIAHRHEQARLMGIWRRKYLPLRKFVNLRVVWLLVRCRKLQLVTVIDIVVIKIFASCISMFGLGCVASGNWCCKYFQILIFFLFSRDPKNTSFINNTLINNTINGERKSILSYFCNCNCNCVNGCTYKSLQLQL